MSASSYTWPFNLFAPGNLNQPILPGWSFAGVNVNYAGNAGIERDVVEKVASFGRQLGVITDVVLELAKDMPDGKEQTPSGEKDLPITQLRDIAAKVKDLKKAHEASIIGEARKAMDRLADFDPKIARNMAESYTDLPPKRGS
jgi:hypothetical protein